MIIQHCPIELNTQQVVYGLCGSFFTLTKKKKQIIQQSAHFLDKALNNQKQHSCVKKKKVLDKYSQCTWTNNHPHFYTKKDLVLHYTQYNLSLIYKQRECYILNLKTETHAIDFFDILYDFINISLQRYLLELMLFVHVKKKNSCMETGIFFMNN